MATETRHGMVGGNMGQAILWTVVAIIGLAAVAYLLGVF